MHKKMIHDLNKLSEKCDSLLVQVSNNMTGNASIRYRLYLLSETARMHAALLEWLHEDEVKPYDYKDALYWQEVKLKKLMKMLD